MPKYEKQDRGNLSAYEEYFAGMDASMQQKIALTTAHFPSSGKIADMGSGSGRGTFDLATLYENLTVIGVDINPTTIKYSRSQYRAKNLSFVVGDIAEKVFENNSLDGILDSSVLHHVTSFNNFDVNQILKTLLNQVAQLKLGGVIIIRDFVIPDDSEKLVNLDLPNNDGTSDSEISELSTASLFEIFSRDFRSSLNQNEGVKYQQKKSDREDFSRFEVTLKTAAEFVLRKDYRDHWKPELLEEYTYFSQKDFENSFRSNNLRIVVSMPLWNPWIISNRFESKFYITDLDNNLQTFPPTNYLIVGEKINKNEGVILRESSRVQQSKPKFLQLKTYQNTETKQLFELIERPNQTIDILPWFEVDGQIFVIAKKDFPRPIVNASRDNKHLNRANYSGYLTEPISAIINKSDANNQQEIGKILLERANISQNEIIEISEANVYFPSAGGIDERVESYLVEISTVEKEPQVVENYTAFMSAGVVRELDALQVLRASHVGGMFDARLEINIYRLLRLLKKSPSSWIGATIEATKLLSQKIQISEIASLLHNKSAMFEQVESLENKFLKLNRSLFSEYDCENKIIAEHEFEYVIPKNLSKNTVAAIPFFQTENETFVGLEFRDLPAVQRFTGSSKITCVPAWRLPNVIFHKFELERFLVAKFPIDFKIEINKSWELGGSYFTSAGISPEVVYPIAVEINVKQAEKSDLKFYNLLDLISNFDQIKDAHLLILANRLAHSLGLLK